MPRVVFRLINKRERDRAARFVTNADANTVCTFTKADKRTLEQNAYLHALCTDIAGQVEWAGKKRDVEAWKDILTAALRSSKHGLDVVPGINGGFVLLGMHTSEMRVGECNELIELTLAFGTEHGVRFHDFEGSKERDGVSSPSRAA